MKNTIKEVNKVDAERLNLTTVKVIEVVLSRTNAGQTHEKNSTKHFKVNHGILLTPVQENPLLAEEYSQVALKNLTESQVTCGGWLWSTVVV